MKQFTETFVDARKVGTPFVVLRTFDAFAATKAICDAFKEKDKIVPASWDAIHGLRGLTDDTGVPAVSEMLNASNCEASATVDLAIALGVLEFATEDALAFIHNPHLVWDTDKKVIQGIINLRNDYKANGNMLVLIVGIGDELPAELQQDCLILETPLPTREQLATIVKNVYAYAANEKEYAKCKGAATDEVVTKCTDALIGLPEFPAEQNVAVNLDKYTGVMDLPALWNRKKEIVSQNPGLTYHAGHETLADMYGCAAWIKGGQMLMDGKRQPTIIVRMDEIQRQLAGSESDSSGTKGNLMGDFLTWVNDKGVVCTLNVGVSGTSKSWAPYCIGGQYDKPIINYSISSMEHKHVGESSRHMRTAHRVLESISDGRIWLIASANNLNGLPPELISRFQRGGIWFFDLPDDDEKNGILDLKIKAYGLDPKQERPAMPNWTGRDIDNMCGKADLFGCSLVDAAQHIVPLMESHTSDIEGMRSAASGRFLSASKAGVYRYTPAPTKHEAKTVVSEGRKFRT